MREPRPRTPGIGKRSMRSSIASATALPSPPRRHSPNPSATCSLRAGASYLRAIGVTEETLPEADALAKLLRLTIDVMNNAG